MMRYFLYILVMSIGVFSYAQDEPPAGEIEDAQIIIEKDKPLTLPKATRLFQKSTVRPVSEDTVSLFYNLSEPHINLETKAYVPMIRNYSSELEESVQKNFVKVGFGNYLSPLLQGYVGTQVDDQVSVGAYVFHESFAKGPVRDDESAYSDTRIDLLGEITNDVFTISPVVEYERESFYYYGRPDDVTPEIEDRVGLNEVMISLPVSYSPNEDVLLGFSPTFQSVTMGADGSTFNQDVGVDLKFTGAYRANDNLLAYGNMSFANWKYTSGYSSSRNVFNINPGVLYSSEPISLKAGVLVSIGSDDSTSGVFVYPDIAFDLSISDELSLFIDVSGGLHTTNLNDLRRQNRYLDDSLSLFNENNKIKVKAGVDYALKPDLSIEPFVEYSFSTYQSLFYHSLSDSSRFAVGYDSEGISTTNFGATVRWINKKSSLVGSMVFSSYQTKLVSEAWYLPTSTLSISYTQQLMDKITLLAGMNVLQGIKAPSPNDGEVVDLSTILDVSLEGRYQLTEQWSGFVQVNNLFGVNYERYLNYPVRGFTGKLGVVYHF